MSSQEFRQAVIAGFDIYTVEIHRAYGRNADSAEYERSASGVLVDFCDEIRYAKRSAELATRLHD